MNRGSPTDSHTGNWRISAGAQTSSARRPLLFAAHDPIDRLNVPDTLKAQMSARVTPPMVLMSDRGIGLASVTGSSLDWHDCLGGHSLEQHLERFGPTSYATDANEWRRSARAGLLSELANALARLSDRDREVLALRFGADLTGPEIAALTGLKLGNVQQILSRCLRRLRRALEGREEEDPAAEEPAPEVAGPEDRPPPVTGGSTRTPGEA